jgi:hypothetical protein
LNCSEYGVFIWRSYLNADLPAQLLVKSHLRDQDRLT